MRPLTELERHQLIVTIARELAWMSSTQYVKDDSWHKAKGLIARLEENGIHGATLKRAVEKLMTENVA
jgi:hypothetical protein